VAWRKRECTAGHDKGEGGCCEENWVGRCGTVVRQATCPRPPRGAMVSRGSRPIDRYAPASGFALAPSAVRGSSQVADRSWRVDAAPCSAKISLVIDMRCAYSIKPSRSITRRTSSKEAEMLPLGNRICPKPWILLNSVHPSSRRTIARTGAPRSGDQQSRLSLGRSFRGCSMDEGATPR
jgi:hypothetical protein